MDGLDIWDTIVFRMLVALAENVTAQAYHLRFVNRPSNISTAL